MVKLFDDYITPRDRVDAGQATSARPPNRDLQYLNRRVPANGIDPHSTTDRTREPVRPPAAPVLVGGGEFEIVPYHIDAVGPRVFCIKAGGLDALFNGTPDQTYSRGGAAGLVTAAGAAGLGARVETATAMKATTLKQIPCAQFFARLSRDALSEGFVRYLAVRIADQRQVIANLVTVDSEQRLGQTLLQLARTLGKKDPRSIRIELKISHEELSEMVGTTRPRISVFMQRFHNLGLIETNRDRFLVIKENKLTDYLAQIA